MSKKTAKKPVGKLMKVALMPEEVQPYKVPKNWVWTNIKSIAEVKGGKRLPAGAEFVDEVTEHPYIRVSDFENGSINTDGLKYISKDTQKMISRYTISSNDVYISIAGTIGKSGIIPDHIDGANLTENAAKISDIKCSSNKFIYYLLNTECLKDQIKNSMKATSQPKLALHRIQDLQIPLPPLNEQKRIADKVERLFDKINQAKQLIKEAKETFELRRAAILDKAFRGELTKTNKYPNPEVVISQSKGATSDDGKSEELYKRLLEICPKTWEIHSLGTLLRDNASICYGIVQTGDETPNGVPTVRAGDLKNENLEVQNLKKVAPEIESEYPRSRLLGDEILVSIRGSVGYVRIVNPNMKGINVSREVAVIPINTTVTQKFLAYYFQSPLIQNFFRKISKGVAQQGINLNQLRTLPIPIPSKTEQEDVVRLLGSVFVNELSINKNLELENQIDVLRSSILTKAFRGELGTNDPAEDSSAELLISLL